MSMYKLTINNSGHGEIQISDFRESFVSELSFWEKTDYEKHWAEASRQLEKGKAVSFITSITDPATSNFVRSWACYPDGGELVFQEQILFLDELPVPFNVNGNSLDTQSKDKKCYLFRSNKPKLKEIQLTSTLKGICCS